MAMLVYQRVNMSASLYKALNMILFMLQKSGVHSVEVGSFVLILTLFYTSQMVRRISEPWTACYKLLPSNKLCKPGWWFQIFFIFTPIWGRFPFWLIFFRWVETTNLKPLWNLMQTFVSFDNGFYSHTWVLPLTQVLQSQMLHGTGIFTIHLPYI